MDAARELGSGARVDGFDISLDQAPPREWLPSNVCLRQWDVFSDCPSDTLEKYDIIHLRLLVLVVQNSDSRPILRKVAKMLKPGDYMQWDDLNYPDTRIKKTKFDLQTPALDELRESVYSRGRQDWVMDLANICKELGFEGAAIHQFEDRTDLIKAYSDMWLFAMDEFGGRLRDFGDTMAAKNMERLVRDSYRESCKGAALFMPKVVCVARKSLT